MWSAVRGAAIVTIALMQSGCGISVPQIPEIWDQTDPKATQHMEMQIKKAIFCELREAVWLARKTYYQNSFQGHVVTTKDDQPIPDSWGAEVTLTFTVDEASKLNPGLSVNNLAQSFTFGLGGTLSSAATRVDKYDTFYTIGEIANVYSKNNVCDVPPEGVLGPKSSSSLFLSELGIREWLPQAAAVSNFLRSSRSDKTGEGPALSSGDFASDSISYDIKFIVVTDVNATPTWKLLRVSTPDSPAFFDASRTRTHDLLITIGPSATEKFKGKNGVVSRVVGPSRSASNSHLAQQIGNAVASAIRSRTSP